MGQDGSPSAIGARAPCGPGTYLQDQMDQREKSKRNSFLIKTRVQQKALTVEETLTISASALADVIKEKARNTSYQLSADTSHRRTGIHEYSSGAG